MKYIVVEIQTMQNGQVATIPTAFDTEREANAKYHQVLSYAAVSGIPCHSAVVLTEEAQFLRRDFFRTDPEPEVQPEDDSIIPEDVEEEPNEVEGE